MTPEAQRILVVANETVGGRALIDAVRKHAESGPVSVRVICPQNQPNHGYVVYDESIRAAAENRLRLTLAQLREAGIDAEGEVMDPDPYSAITDALAENGYDEVIISTHPETRSGWLRRDLIDRVREAGQVPVEHVVVDLDVDRAEVTHTLVIANQTMGGQPLMGLLKGKSAEKPHRFVVVTPQSDDEAPERLAHMLGLMEKEGLQAVGQVGHPDPFTAIQNTLQYYAIDEIVISTFPATRSGWLRTDLIARVRASTAKDIEHVVVSDTERAETGA
ncbi:MAG: hypothetical protein WD844_04420 [Thermoleophilaceae bacterium]